MLSASFAGKVTSQENGTTRAGKASGVLIALQRHDRLCQQPTTKPRRTAETTRNSGAFLMPGCERLRDSAHTQSTWRASASSSGAIKIGDECLAAASFASVRAGFGLAEGQAGLSMGCTSVVL